MTRLADGPALARRVASALAGVRGVQAVALGGSFARGNADDASDVDLGIYYRRSEPPDLEALRDLAATLDPAHGRDAVTEPGEWGPWINGGAWLTIEGRRVDWLYRELERVESVIADCREGRFTSDYQPGHPHAFHSHMYLGEIALARPLFDPHELLDGLKRQAIPYPPMLKREVVDRFVWEARFALDLADKPVARGESWYVAGALFRSVACLVQALFALNGRYFLNEKGAIRDVMTFERRPDAFAEAVERAFATVGDAPAALEARVAEIRSLVDVVAAHAGEPPRPSV
jgi:predicted nucleotidyltransferase